MADVEFRLVQKIALIPFGKTLFKTHNAKYILEKYIELNDADNYAIMFGNPAKRFYHPSFEFGTLESFLDNLICQAFDTPEEWEEERKKYNL